MLTSIVDAVTIILGLGDIFSKRVPDRLWKGGSLNAPMTCIDILLD